MPVLKRDTHYHTYADYLIWSNTYGDELIDGTAYVREPPSPTRSHQAILVELSRQIANALKNKPYKVYSAPFDVRLPKANEADGEIDTVVQPDLLIIADLQKLDERGVRGAPDWLAEILSPSTATYDETIQLRAYERAGVREVWLIHPTNRTLKIHKLASGRYNPVPLIKLEGKTQLTAIPDVTIDWNPVLAEL
jgi:Uma2 family endonuclease